MNPPVFTLRDATPEDEPFLFELYASTREEELAPVPWTPEQKLAFLNMQFFARKTSYAQQFPDASDQIILREGMPAGRVLVRRQEAGILLVDIALMPAARGHGIGTALLKQLVDEARVTRRPVELCVDQGSRAEALYVRVGFRTLSEDGIYRRMEWRPDGASTQQAEN